MEAKRVVTERSKDGKILKYQYLINGSPVPEGHKYCPACSSIKLKTEFSLKGNSCKPCANKRARDHHKKRMENKEYRQNRREHYNAINKQAKRKAIEYMGGCCSDCGKTFPDSVYDFHHLDMTTKEGNPSKLLSGNWEKAKEELSKCVLLCSNCHRIRHFEGGSI